MPVLVAIVVALLFGSCGAFESAGSAAKKVGGYIGGTIIEYTACPLELESLIECGHVFQCAAEADTPSGHIEICIDDDDQPEQLDAIEAMWGDCEPTPRHQGLCSYCCGPSCGRGCNGFSGCYCPEVTP